MNQELQRFIREIYSLRHIIRYNNIPKINLESVAEHSFFVTAIVLRLHKYYDFKLERALIMSTIHDYIESYIGDVTRDVKNKYKRIAEAIKEAEEEAWPEFCPEYTEYMIDLEKGETIEAKIVKLADLLSVVQYTETEVGLGNKGYMLNVYNKTIKAIDEHFKELEVYKK